MEMTLTPAKEIVDLLLPAYLPCSHLGVECAGARWEPSSGFVPRGFCGAIGEVSEVRLILITAEPGDPIPDESYSGTPSQIMEQAINASFKFYDKGRSEKGRDYLFAKNLRDVLDLAWPNTSFERQLRRTWIMDSYLCSAKNESGSVPHVAEKCCGTNYLSKILALFPDALVIAFGHKAQSRLKRLGIPAEPVFSLAPQGCYARGARESWESIPQLLAERNFIDVTENDLNGRFLPLLVPKEISLPDRSWSDHEMEKMRRGHKETEQQPGYEAFYDGNELHLIRTLTGFEVYSVRFAKVADGWKIATVKTETDVSRIAHRTYGDQIDELLGVLDHVLLQKQPKDQDE